MKLLIDAQLFQSNTWNRGMGKYSLDLLAALAANKFFDTYSSVELILNEHDELDTERAKVLKDLYDFKLVPLKLQTIDKHSDIRAAQLANQAILDQYLAGSGRGDTEVEFFVLSLFEDHYASAFPTKVMRKMLLFYDIIPYLFANQYLIHDESRNHYFSRFPIIFEADQIFTISKTTMDDLITFLGIPPKKLVNIDGAPITLQRAEVTPKRPESAPNAPFILFPSGNDLRKNNERTIKAFDIFNQKFGNQYFLLVTSTFDERTEAQLGSLANNVIFTGNVSEAEIAWLFAEAQAVLFPTIYEGLGLPILEAITSGTTPVCSDIPVFREMSEEPILDYFNPYDILDIAHGLERAVHEPFSAKKYQPITDKYQWSRTADLFRKGHKQHMRDEVTDAQKPRLAIVGPHTRGMSGIAYVNQQMHAELARFFDITYYLEDNDSNQTKVEYLTYVADCHDVGEFDEAAYRQFDHVIYHMGNSDYHCMTYWLAQRYPGYVVVHDTDLSGLAGVLVQKGYISESRRELEQKLSSMLGLTSENTVSLLNTTLGVLVHSTYAKEQAEQALLTDDIAVHRLQLPVPEPTVVSRDFHKKSFNIGMAGVIHSVKGLEIVHNLAVDPDFLGHHFTIFGWGFAASTAQLEEISALPNVTIAADVTDFEYQGLMASLDVYVNYRPTYRGEASLTTLQALRMGVAVLVRDIGWYHELPDEAVIKVNSEDEVKEQVARLIAHPQRMRAISDAAIETARTKFSLAGYAQDTHKVLQAGSENINAVNAALLRSGKAFNNRAKIQKNWQRFLKSREG